MKAKILLVEADESIRADLHKIMQQERELDLITGLGDVAAIVDLTRQHKPDLIVMDTELLENGRGRPVRRMIAAAPDMRILALSRLSKNLF